MPQGQHGSGCLLAAAKRQRPMEARMGTPWGLGSLSALFPAPSCEPQSGNRRWIDPSVFVKCMALGGPPRDSGQWVSNLALPLTSM